MPNFQSTLKSDVIDLASKAFTTFCDDMSGMFGVAMSCRQVNVNENASAEVEKYYKTLSAVYSVKVSGALNEDFRILIDRAGLFTITGVVVMLPQSRILSSAKRGTLADANEISDAVSEVGNLMIGSWDRSFRAAMGDNTRFLHTDTFVGDPCAENNGVLDLARGEEVTFVSYEMSVGEYPAFKCGVYLPDQLFDESRSDPEPDAQAVSEAEAVVAEIPEAVAAAAQESAPQERPTEPGKTKTEVVPTEGHDSVLMTAQSVSVNPGADLVAKDLMHTQVHWVSVDDTVSQAQVKMQETDVSYLLVGEAAKLEGIVTRSDLASAASIYLRPIFSKWRRPEDDATLQIRLKWIMSKQIYSVKPETPLSNIIHLTCKYDISCLPVVDAGGQVLGVVTTKDLLKCFVSRDLSSIGVTVA